ncbi:MAG: hypothetical protein DLM50_00815 [Candidatus Meridianibacter frigidus]|nr:MAG: hypothetical protein DLM50_00815 [Candidatus Eremiobacteraeota bacterium]
MRKDWRVVTAVLAFAALAILVEGVVLSGRDMPPPPGAQPVLLGLGAVTAHHMKTRSWAFDYDHAQTSPDGSLAEIDGIHNGVLFKNGKPALKLSAKHITANTVSQDFTATGRVHVEQTGASMPRSFDTDLIVWSNATKTLTLSHRSLIRTGSASLTIANASINVETGKIKIGSIAGSVNI